MKTVYYNKANKFDWDMLYNEIIIYSIKKNRIGKFKIKRWK